MFSKWTFGRKVGAGFAVSVIALLVIAVSGYRSTASLIENNRLVAHTHLVKEQLFAIRQAITDAETGARGYVVSGKEDYLEPFTRGTAAIDAALSSLRSLVSDNPSQERRLDELRPQLDAKIAELRHAIEQRKISFEAAAEIVSSDGKRLMDGVRRVLKEMDDEETRLLAVRNEDAESSASIATAVIEWGSGAALILTVLVAWLITSSLSKQVGLATRNMQAASTELQAAANQQASGAREQSTAMNEIATTISELLATSRQIADSARRVSQIAAETASGAKAGGTTVSKGSEAIATVRRQVDLIVTHMVELGRRSQQVGSVLDIVAELAEQTNILAINATIEAAGAGEAGRRFGVVADEIRKLADRVGASTKEIRGMVEDVRGAVNTTVMATEAGSKAVDAGALQVAEMATSFRQIANLVGTTTDAAREIELSTKQQATAVEQVNVAITNVAQATQETEASAGQTLATSSQITQLSTELLSIVQAT